MKKGFTLIEVIAVIAVISIIILLVMPNILNSVNNKRTDISETSKKMIYDATDMYVKENEDIYTSNNKQAIYCIKLETLVKNGKLERPIKDLKTDKEIPLNKNVKVTIDDYNQYNYELVKEDDCNTTIPIEITYTVSNNYSKEKELIINYPSGNYIKKYKIISGTTKEDIKVEEENVSEEINKSIVFTSNGKIEVWIENKTNGSILSDITIDITKIDTTAPSIVSVTGNPTAWSQSATLTINTASDNGSGLADKPYSFDDGETWQESNSKRYTVNTNGIIIKVKDKIGNIYTHDKIDITKIDTTAPSIVSVTGNPTAWSQSATLTVNTATDNDSGLADKPYSFDNGETWQESNSKQYTANTNGIIIKVKDKANNIYTHDAIDVTKVDSVTPTLTMTAGKYALTNTNNVYTVKFGASSGKVTCINTSRSNAAVTTFKSIDALGPNSIKCTATSNAGKSASKTVTYNMQTVYLGSQLSYNGNGYLSGTSLILPTGSTQYGPYKKINTGCYQVIYYGNNLDKYTIGYQAYDTLGGTATNFKLLTFNYISSDSNYYIKVPSNYNYIEFVLSNNGTQTITISNIEVRYIGATSACPSS